MTAVLQRIAEIANGLTKGELHVLLQLAARADSTDALVATASSRELAEATNLARASVQSAIDSLNEKRMITSSAGSVTQPSVHRLDCLETVENGCTGPTTEPRVAQNLGQGGLKSGPVVAQQLSQGGLTAKPLVAQILSQSGPKIEPPVAQNPGQGGLEAEPRLYGKSGSYEVPHIERADTCTDSTCTDSIDLKIEKTIDRLQAAKKSDYDPEVFELARNRMASHHAKFAREQNRQPGLPDDTITARFLSVADWPRLEALLCDLSGERKEAGHSYAWYVTVALQRIQGVSPNELREAQNSANRKPNHSIRPNSISKNSIDPSPEAITPLAPDSTTWHLRRRSPSFEDLNCQVHNIASLKQL